MKLLPLLISAFFLAPTLALSVEWKAFDTLVKKQIGVKYLYGGNTPHQGFDCSGLVEYVYAKSGKPMPHGTKYLTKMGEDVPIKDIKKGDLLFFSPGSNHITHVGIYLGDGIMAHAPSSGKTVTVIEVFKHVYWKNEIVSARRIVPTGFFTFNKPKSKTITAHKKSKTIS